VAIERRPILGAKLEERVLHNVACTFEITGNLKRIADQWSLKAMEQRLDIVALILVF
jgi:hypothetical protein